MEDTLIQVRWSTQEMLSWIQQAGYSNFFTLVIYYVFLVCLFVFLLPEELKVKI